MRHAAWVINRFSVTAGRGITSFELLSGKPYTGKVCQFGEPVFGFQKSHSKGNPQWRRMVFLGKIDPQDSYLLYNGTIWFWQGLSEGSTLAGKVIWRFTSASTVPHTSTGAALVEEWCRQRAVVHPLHLQPSSWRCGTLQILWWGRWGSQAESSWRATWRLWNSQHGHPRQTEPYAGDGSTASGLTGRCKCDTTSQSHWHFRWSSGRRRWSISRDGKPSVRTSGSFYTFFLRSANDSSCDSTLKLSSSRINWCAGESKDTSNNQSSWWGGDGWWTDSQKGQSGGHKETQAHAIEWATFSNDPFSAVWWWIRISYNGRLQPGPQDDRSWGRWRSLARWSISLFRCSSAVVVRCWYQCEAWGTSTVARRFGRRNRTLSTHQHGCYPAWSWLWWRCREEPSTEHKVCQRLAPQTVWWCSWWGANTQMASTQQAGSTRICILGETATCLLTHQLQALMFWTCFLYFGFNDAVIWMMLQEEFHAVIRWWQLWTSKMLS